MPIALLALQSLGSEIKWKHRAYQKTGRSGWPMDKIYFKILKGASEINVV